MIHRTTIGPCRLINCVGDHALREQRVEGLNSTIWQMPCHVHRTGKEAAVQQVQNRMLDPADILVDVHPISRVIQIGWGGCIG